MEKTEAASIIEAILFVSGDPVDSRAIAQALLITEDEVGAALDELARGWTTSGADCICVGSAPRHS